METDTKIITFSQESPLVFTDKDITDHVRKTLDGVKQQGTIFEFRFSDFYSISVIDKWSKILEGSWLNNEKNVKIDFISEDALSLIYQKVNDEKFNVESFRKKLLQSYLNFIEKVKKITDLHLTRFPSVNVKPYPSYSIGNGNAVIDTLWLHDMTFVQYDSKKPYCFKAKQKIILDKCKFTKNSLLAFITPHLVLKDSSLVSVGGESGNVENVLERGDKFTLEFNGVNKSVTADVILMVSKYLTQLEFHDFYLPDGDSYKKIQNKCKKLKSFVWCNNSNQLQEEFKKNKEFMTFLTSMNKLTFCNVSIDDIYFRKIFNEFKDKKLNFNDCILTKEQEKKMEEKMKANLVPW